MTLEKTAATYQLRKRAIQFLIIIILLGFFQQLNAFYSGNFCEVIPDRVYRSAQPEPDQLKHYIKQYGIRSIINLRGYVDKITDEECRIAEENNVDLYVLEGFSAYKIPSRPALLKLIATIEKVEKPLLIHCRQGIDRTGTASVLAVMTVGEQPFDLARWEGYIPPGPWKRKYGKHHISDIFGMYAQYCNDNQLNRNDLANFKSWAVNIYSPHYYYVEIDGPDELHLTPGECREIDVSVRNISGGNIPAGHPGKKFHLMMFEEYVVGGDTRRTIQKPMTLLSESDIPHKYVLNLKHTVVAPQEPGEYIWHYDILEEDVTRFGHQKSPTPTCRIIVQDTPTAHNE